MKYKDVPVLMYHDIGAVDSPWCVSPEEFAAQVKFLYEQGYKTITLGELREGVEQGKELMEKAVVITFDDARKGVHTYTYPVLEQYGFRAILFVVPQWVDGKDVPEEEKYSSFLTWEELWELGRKRFEVGSHTFSHRSLQGMSREDIVQELERAERRIAEKTNKKVSHFSYPYGILTPEALELVYKRYMTAVTTERGFRKELRTYARQWVLRGMSLEQFGRLLQQPRLSVCMIVKDEEKHLAECLTSVREVASEIIVGDTGSADRTKEIAQEYGAKVLDVPWTDDFAAARNAVLKEATGDWILSLDADEVIAEEDRAKIIEAINSWEVAGFWIATRNYCNDSTIQGWQPAGGDHFAKTYAGWFPSVKVRLWQQQENILFQGRVHEVIPEEVLRSFGKVAMLPVPIHHYGFEQSGEKKEAYLKMVERKVAEEPSSARAHYELGVLYKEQGKYDLAEEAFSQSLKLDSTFVTPLLNFGIVQQKQGKYEDAMKTLQAVLLRDAGSADACFALGYCSFMQNDMEKAEEYFTQAVQRNPLLVEAYVNLGAIKERQGNLSHALAYLKKALQLHPSHARAYYNIGVVYEKQMQIPAAIQMYEKARECGYARAEELQERIGKMKEFLEKNLLVKNQ